MYITLPYGPWMGGNYQTRGKGRGGMAEQLHFFKYIFHLQIIFLCTLICFRTQKARVVAPHGNDWMWMCCRHPGVSEDPRTTTDAQAEGEL